MKLLLINKFLFPKGGDAISTLATGGLFRSKGHDVVYWGMDHPNNGNYPYKELFVPHIDFNDPGGLDKRLKTALSMLYSFGANKRLEKLLRQFKPDIVHLNNFAHQISPSILHVFKRYGIPVVMTMHDYKMVCASYAMLNNGKTCELCRNGKFYNCLLQACVKSSKAKSLLNTVEMYLHHKILHIYDLIDTYISPSMFLKSKLKEMGFNKRIEYIPNFVNISEYEPKYDFSERTIVYFGRLSKEKGISTLIKAVKGKGTKLKIVGEGPMREELAEEVKNEGIKNVEFLGYKTGQELKDIVRNSMFVVTPSQWYENNPRSVIEAFALGKPVIGARIGGIPELVKDNYTGLTFEMGNFEDLSSKIEFLIKNPEQVTKFGENARKFVEKELNDDLYFSRLMSLYQSKIIDSRKVINE